MYYLCVENCCCMKKYVTDVMHTISVTGRIFQAGECATAHLCSTVQTANHLRCRAYEIATLFNHINELF